MYKKFYELIYDYLYQLYYKEPQNFSIVSNTIFWNGMLNMYNTYSAIPLDLAESFEGTCGEFLLFKLEYVGQPLKLDNFKNIFNKLIKNVFAYSNLRNYSYRISCDLLVANTYIFSVYYAVNRKQVKALNEWAQKNLRQTKKAYLSSVVALMDSELEKEMKIHGI